jgi:hypothetical protein
MEINIKRVKIETTVPKENLEELRTAMCNAGAGVIGNYTFCTVTTPVTGTYMPNEEAHPYIRKSTNLEYVSEEKIETFCDIEKINDVIKELRKHHPYEEPMINIIPLLDEKDLLN